MARKGAYKETYTPSAGNPGVKITISYAGKLDEAGVTRMRPIAQVVAALGLSARSRVLTEKRGALGETAGPHFISGGMWAGLTTKVKVNNTATNTIQGKSRTSKKYVTRDKRVQIWLGPPVFNRIKAWSASQKHTLHILANTPAEIEAARSFLARELWEITTGALSERGTPPPLTGDPHTLRFLRSKATA